MDFNNQDRSLSAFRNVVGKNGSSRAFGTTVPRAYYQHLPPQVMADAIHKLFNLPGYSLRPSSGTPGPALSSRSEVSTTSSTSDTATTVADRSEPGNSSPPWSSQGSNYAWGDLEDMSPSGWTPTPPYLEAALQPKRALPPGQKKQGAGKRQDGKGKRGAAGHGASRNLSKNSSPSHGQSSPDLQQEIARLQSLLMAQQRTMETIIKTRYYTGPPLPPRSPSSAGEGAKTSSKPGDLSDD